MSHESVQTKKSETALREEEVLAFWKQEGIFEKSLTKNAPNGEFVFYDGPPFATGLPHHGSLLSSIIKDVIPRYKTMRGFRVRRRWGWDCHGLPIESLVEKQLGLKTKKDIETIGVQKFNETARATVLQFVHDWEKYIERVGRWVDFKNSYKTMDNTYIESVWWALKQLWDKDYLYEGKKVLMYCPHCETPLSKAEIAMDDTYKDITEEAVTVKFKIKNPEKIGLSGDVYVLAWTTTPWTLPGNVALAVGNEIQYIAARPNIEQGTDTYIVASERTNEVFSSPFTKDAEFTGSQLIGLEYEPLFEVRGVEKHEGKKHVILSADFVSTQEGTGVVHTAVMYGEDDFALGQKEGLPMVQLLNPNATYNDEVPEFLRGEYIKKAEKIIKGNLEERGLLFARQNNTHSYPHCYRCGTPLIYNAVPSWFIAIQKVKSRMLAENEKVNWVPEHLKTGRFKNIVANAPDWNISRSRYWASPLPIWKQKGGDKVLIVGSLAELRAKAKTAGNTYVVMRHGEAEANVKGIHNSNLATVNPLTQKGKSQVHESAIRLRDSAKIDYIIASPMQRTKETAEIVREILGLDPSAVLFKEDLREIEFGVLEERPISDWNGVYASGADPLSNSPEGGESLRDVRRRVGSVLLGLENDYRKKNILIIAHDTPLWMIDAVASAKDDEVIKKETTLDFLAYGEAREMKFAPYPHNENFELDFHRPYIDSIVLADSDGYEYERIPEVVDCWVESGSMPFAEQHYPFENKDGFEKRSPGDFIAEYIAQTRTWFYYMHAMGVLLFDRLAFKNVVSTGTILAANGDKISKSLRNYTDPLDLINQFGSDSLRYYLMSSTLMQSEDVRFKDEDVRDAHNRIVGILWNSYKFFELYKDSLDTTVDPRNSAHVLDRWILARLDELQVEVTDAMERYDLPRAMRPVRIFVEDYSTWYVRRSRERVKSEGEDMKYALATQKHVLEILSKLIAPVMPFLAEGIYKGVTGGESVHLVGWPSSVKKGFFARMFGASSKSAIIDEMQIARGVVSRALKEREVKGINVRQPLSKMYVSEQLSPEIAVIIADEVNVRAVVYKKDIDGVELDTELTAELKEEGFVREFTRAVQGMRKEDGFLPKDEARVTVTGGKELIAILNSHKANISLTINARELVLETGVVDTDARKVGSEQLKIQIRKV